MFAPVRRATLWIPGTGPDHDTDRAHLFVILTDPDPDGMVLVVPICSATTKSDGTCIVGAGDHPFLKHKSFAAYYRLNTFNGSALVEQEKKKAIQYRGMLDEKVFALVCAGVQESRQAAPVHKKYFATQTAKSEK
ncbi:MAG: hypothetical protein NTV56_18905 [Alphaproteobacteria bacterium]|nr:hypothetical protein [Alphaproteobacteria bacterium]